MKLIDKTMNLLIFQICRRETDLCRRYHFKGTLLGDIFKRGGGGTCKKKKGGEKDQKKREKRNGKNKG